MTCAIKPQSNGLADLLVAFEGEVLSQMDRYEWSDDYSLFWHRAMSQVAPNVVEQESAFILWLDRFLALQDMSIEDRQGQAWLQELEHSRMRLPLKRALQPPILEDLDIQEQQQIHRLFTAILLKNASPSQRAFLIALMR
ncbi:MAG: hypothetical protein AAF125_07615 [Chloroflexota bacterium]